MSLRVLEPGLYSLVVDLGRPRCRSLGVPLGGAADRAAFLLGNALVGNPPEAAALEITLVGPRLEATEPTAGVVVGAPFLLTSTRQQLTVGRTFTLHPGEQLHLASPAVGLRAYLCVVGGFQTPLILGSRSALVPLSAGDDLVCAASTLPTRFLPSRWPTDTEPGLLRTLDGPQAAWFDREAFFGQSYTVTPASNRMGLRLRGRPLAVPPRELVSEPVCPGTVQVTRDGQCIILGVDGQTIGGYPKIGQVISADLDRLGQLRPGDAVRFEPVTLEVAERCYRQRQAELNEWQVRLRAAEWFGSTPRQSGTVQQDPR